MSARVASTKAGIDTILAYLKAAFPDHTVDAYEDHRFRDTGSCCRRVPARDSLP